MRTMSSLNPNRIPRRSVPGRRIFSLLALVFSIGTLSPVETQAHADQKNPWEMTPTELTALQESILRHRQEFLTALNQAANNGVYDQQRPYRFDSDSQVVNIPKSVLNQVIVSSLNLETAQMKMYLFCESGCEHSLVKDLAGHARQKETVSALRALWPKIKSSFAVLWHDIPVGTWKRVIHAAAYSRWLAGKAKYQAKAYGTFSMTAGAAGFGAAFAVTEVAESMFMGPLHFVCQANYLWSMAFGSAIASLSRDLRAMFLFEKETSSFLRRIRNVFSTMGTIRNARRIENRILFRTLASEEGLGQFEKLTQRQALSSTLAPLMEKLSAKKAVASDTLLWSEVAWKLRTANDPKNLSENSIETSIQPRERLFDTELLKIFSPEISRDETLRRWQDLNASLRTLLRVFRNDTELQNLISRDQGPWLKIQGQLDAELRKVDLFMLSYIPKLNTSSEGGPIEAAWLKNILGEWMSLAIESSSGSAELRVVELRRAHLESIVDSSVRQGKPIALAPEGYRELLSSMAKPVERTRSGPTTPKTPRGSAASIQCQDLFVSTPN